MTYREQYEADKAMVEEALKGAFRDRAPRGDIYDAMNYSLLAGGNGCGPSSPWRPAACAAGTPWP